MRGWQYSYWSVYALYNYNKLDLHWQTLDGLISLSRLKWVKGSKAWSVSDLTQIRLSPAGQARQTLYCERGILGPEWKKNPGHHTKTFSYRELQIIRKTDCLAFDCCHFSGWILSSYQQKPAEPETEKESMSSWWWLVYLRQLTEASTAQLSQGHHTKFVLSGTIIYRGIKQVQLAWELYLSIRSNS